MARKLTSQSDGEFWADKLMDLANYAILGLVFGQLTTVQVRLDVLSLGIAVWLFLASMARRIRKKK